MALPLKLIVWPTPQRTVAAGEPIVGVFGGWLPASISTESVAVAPAPSVTRSLTVTGPTWV